MPGTPMEILEDTVKEICDALIEDVYDGNANSFHADLQRSGCISGMIPSLIYYRDSCEFFDRHKDAINYLLKQALLNTGHSSIVGLFGNKWDKEDPLALNELNKNDIAWWAFESVTQSLRAKEIECKTEDTI